MSKTSISVIACQQLMYLDAVPVPAESSEAPVNTPASPADTPASPSLRRSERASKGVPPPRADSSGAELTPPAPVVDEDVMMDDTESAPDESEETPRKPRISKRAIVMSPTSERDAPPAQRPRRLSSESIFDNTVSQLHTVSGKWRTLIYLAGLLWSLQASWCEVL